MHTEDSNDLYVCLGAAIVEQRQRLGMSQEALASKTGMGRVFISTLENGRVAASIASIARIARGLNLKTSVLIKRAEDKLVAKQ